MPPADDAARTEARGGERPSSVVRYEVGIGEHLIVVEVVEYSSGLAVRVGDGPVRPVVVGARADDGFLSLIVGDRVLTGLAGTTADGLNVVLPDLVREVVVRDERAARLARAAAQGRPRPVDSTVKAPMPGLVVSVNVEPGQRVERGQTLVVLSAMKMQNELTARDDAVVRDVLVGPGQTVDQNQVLIRLGD
ncbi:MAG: biotin/lipoyl-binding protein [Chloroflexi bacterium]|nr:biotin/lipoyl-binding protein [Chloroflexota bacterium]